MQFPQLHHDIDETQNSEFLKYQIPKNQEAETGNPLSLQRYKASDTGEETTALVEEAAEIIKIAKSDFRLNAKAAPFEFPVKHGSVRNHCPEERNTSWQNANVNCQLANFCNDQPNLTPNKNGHNHWGSYEEGYLEFPSKVQYQNTRNVDSERKSINEGCPEFNAYTQEYSSPRQDQPLYPSNYDHPYGESPAKHEIKPSSQYPVQHPYQGFQVPSSEFDIFSNESRLGNCKDYSENRETDYPVSLPPGLTSPPPTPDSCNVMSELSQMHISPHEYIVKEYQQSVYNDASISVDQLPEKKSTSRSSDSEFSMQARIVYQNSPETDSATYSRNFTSPNPSSCMRNFSRGTGYDDRKASRPTGRSFAVSCPNSFNRTAKRSLKPSHSTPSRILTKSFSRYSPNTKLLKGKGLAMGPHDPYPQNQPSRESNSNAYRRKVTDRQHKANVQPKHGFLKGLQMGPHDSGASFMAVNKQRNFQHRRKKARNIRSNFRRS